LASKPVATVSSGLASKPSTTVFCSLAAKLVVAASPGLASKPVVGFLVEPQNQGGGWFLSLGLKTGSYGFGDLGLKITAAVSWFGPQNQTGFDLSVVPQNWRREVGTEHASRSSGLLHVEASLARVFESGLRTVRAVTMVVNVAPSQTLRWRQVEDGWVDAMSYVGPCYPTFAVFNVLGLRA
jgi:hypothetical protein